MKRPELHSFRFHDHRHSARHYPGMGGATLAEIAELLGRGLPQMAIRYPHLTEPHTPQGRGSAEQQHLRPYWTWRAKRGRTGPLNPIRAIGEQEIA